jgi:hypothetical protein
MFQNNSLKPHKDHLFLSAACWDTPLPAPPPLIECKLNAILLPIGRGKEGKLVDCYWIAIYLNNPAVPPLLPILLPFQFN